MATPELNRDNDPLATGTHKGASGGLTINDPGADFLSCGITVGLAVKNDSDGSSGLTTAVTEDTVTTTLTGGTANTWTNGDTYEIYRTATYNSIISRIWTDIRHGRKATDKSQLVDGLFPEDRDLDEEDENVFGPGQPERY